MNKLRWRLYMCPTYRSMYQVLSESLFQWNMPTPHEINPSNQHISDGTLRWIWWSLVCPINDQSSLGLSQPLDSWRKLYFIIGTYHPRSNGCKPLAFLLIDLQSLESLTTRLTPLHPTSTINIPFPHPLIDQWILLNRSIPHKNPFAALHLVTQIASPFNQWLRSSHYTQSMAIDPHW
jgi:hypothetical protein